VRAALFSNSGVTPKDGAAAALLGFHMLNTFDLFEGIVRSEKGDLETTQWTIVHDMTRLKTYFRGYQSLQVQSVDLTKMDFTRAGLRQIALSQLFSVSDDTEKAVPLSK
jgi:penicillin V acylase-like amidase (Ntn superfamily)